MHLQNNQRVKLQINIQSVALQVPTWREHLQRNLEKDQRNWRINVQFLKIRKVRLNSMKKSDLKVKVVVINVWDGFLHHDNDSNESISYFILSTLTFIAPPLPSAVLMVTKRLHIEIERYWLVYKQWRPLSWLLMGNYTLKRM